MKVSQVIELKSEVDYKEIIERKSSYENKRKSFEVFGLLCSVVLVGFYYLCAIGLFFVLMGPMMR